eukprot:7386642-Prymnesium_polylepis.1
MAFSGLQAPELLFSAGDAATCPLRRNRHGEAGAPYATSRSARSPPGRPGREDANLSLIHI